MVTVRRKQQRTVRRNGGPRILIAEDEPLMAEALRIKLARSGFRPTVVADGVRAVRAIARGTFAVVLLDLVLPRMDGFGVLELLRARGNRTPVIVMSNLPQPDEGRRTRELGAVDFLVKSNVSIASILDRVRRITGPNARGR